MNQKRAGEEVDERAMAFTLPQEFYVGEEVFAAEQREIFYKRWHCVGRLQQLAQPGDFIRVHVAGQALICTRDEHGGLHAFYDSCRHRGTRLTNGERGRFPGARIQCAYHRWTYSCHGELLAAPRMDDTSEFCRADWSLVSVAVAAWQGFVWVNLAESPPALHEEFDRFLRHFDAWQLDQLQTLHEVRYELKTNWKLVLENFSECYHCPSIHPGLAQLSSPLSATNDFTRGILLGGPMQLTHQSMTTTGRQCCAPIATLDDQDRQRTYYYTLFPNLMLGLHPDFVIAWQLEPQSPNRTMIHCRWLFHPDVMENGGCEPEGAIEFWDRTNRQDWDICERSYEGICSRGYRPGPLAANEVMVREIDRLVLEALDKT
jgi:Rieske 2Fe-2S family protein